MRILAGQWRGRRLVAPPGLTTRPTGERLRQALFDMLWHAKWGGRDLLDGAIVLDLFAGTGALGLEALSRGAAHATFVETDRAALATLRANIACCGAGGRAAVQAADACHVGPGPAASLVFVDPPYGLGLVGKALARVASVGRLAPGALVAAELAAAEATPMIGEVLGERTHGAGRVVVARVS